jgi:hypothetical protein
MLTVPLNDPRLETVRRDDTRAPCARRQMQVGATTDAPDLVEWELSATQVGSLIAALALCFGLVSLFV